METRKEKLLQQYDRKMRPKAKLEGNIRWYSPMDEPFQIAGFAWFAQERKYRRLPTLPPGAVPEAVEHLANHTAGGQIRFQTDSTSISIRVKLTGKADMAHMPATGQCGVDCYVDSPDTIIPRKYGNTTIYDHTQTEYECAFFSNWTATMRNVCLSLPLYQGVEEISIGLDENATLLAAPSYVSDKKVIVYGTSITQGGCASRPGMMYTNILSRRIPLEFLNLGFSGNGKGEPEVAEIIAQIDNPACLVVDYEGNCVSTELFRQTLPEFIKIYREAHPLTPILIVSRIPYAREQLTPHLNEMRMERMQFEKELVKERREQGDLNIYFFEGSKSLGDDDFFESTVDGSHPTDLGFLRMANALEPVLKTLVL
ncbi:SGNH/GDSL hydrolase family protein [Paenibacillus sp. IITD108]